MRQTKSIISLLIIITGIVCLGAVTPVLAFVDQGSIRTGNTTVVNYAPTIENGKFIFQIVNTGGTTWKLEADFRVEVDNFSNAVFTWISAHKTGYRQAPYIFEGEELKVSIDISDSPGGADLGALTVRIALGTAVEFPCNLESKITDPASGLSVARYRGSLIVGTGTPQGMYDVTASARDAQGATVYFNPLIYKCSVDIIVKPTIALVINRASIKFPLAMPGTGGVAASENPVSLQPKAYIGNERIPVIFSLQHFGMNMQSTSGGNNIPVGNIVWSLSNQTGGAMPLQSGSQTLAGSVKENGLVQLYYWLNVPSIQAPGKYQGNINFKAVPR